MQKTIFLLLILPAFFSCNNKQSVAENVSGSTAKSFFPVTDYILGQIHELNNTPVTPLKITTYKGNLDSVWMKPDQTKVFVQNFITPIIDSVKLHRLFKEKSFLDQSINSFTLTYDPVEKLADTFILRRWDVYIDADDNTVKRIYIEKKLLQNDTTYLQKLTWRSGNYCKIITVNEKDTSLQNLREEQLIWNFDE
jgi:hypothetical protein